MELRELKTNHSFRIFLEASVILVLVTSFFVMTQNDEPASASEASTMDTTEIALGGGLDFFVKVVGESQGWIPTDTTRAGKEDLFFGVQYSHSLYVPYDVAAGLPLSRRVHTPVTIILEEDSGFVLLYKAFGNGELLHDVIIYFWRPTSSGAEEQYFTIELDNAHIYSLNGFQQHNRNLDSYHPGYGLEVSFVYETITWSWSDPAREHSETWTEVNH